MTSNFVRHFVHSHHMTQSPLREDNPKISEEEKLSFPELAKQLLKRINVKGHSSKISV